MYNKGRSGWTKHIDFILLDLLCLQVSFVCSHLFQHGFAFPFAQANYLELSIYLTIADLLVISLYDSMKNVLRRGYYIEATLTIKHTVLVVSIILGLLFVVKTSADYSRRFIILGFIFYLISSYIVRIIWKNHIQKKVGRREGKRRILIISNEANIKSAFFNIVDNNYSKFQVIGVVILKGDGDGNKEIDNYLQRAAIDEVYIDLPRTEKLSKETIAKLVDMGITVHRKIEEIIDVPGKVHDITRIGNSSILTISTNMFSFRQLIAKRVMDVIGGIIGCIFTGILFIFIAPCIYIKSPGSIFFKQTRVGRNGRHFEIYKFRSMYLDAEERKAELQRKNKYKDSLMFKIKYDPRIIGNEKGRGIGYFIRNHSLDEFPQFFNVLKGDMSLVGTRPPTIDEWDKYEITHRGRMAIKPGLTGIWQISDRDNIESFDRIVEMDKEYIYGQWTLGRDIKIILKTILLVVKG